MEVINMATKSELLEAIAVLDADAAVEGKTNAELAELLDELSQADPEPVAPTPEPEPAPTPAKSGAARVVAPGCSIVCLKGVLVAGDVMLPEYVAGGKNTIAHLVKAGKLV